MRSLDATLKRAQILITLHQLGQAWRDADDMLRIVHMDLRDKMEIEVDAIDSTIMELHKALEDDAA